MIKVLLAGGACDEPYHKTEQRLFKSGTKTEQNSAVNQKSKVEMSLILSTPVIIMEYQAIYCYPTF